MKETKSKNRNSGEKNLEKLEKKIQELALTIDKVEDEKLEIENQFKKALADYHNLLKNSEKRDQMRFFQTRKSLSENMIPSLDAIMMAIESSKDIKFDEESRSWVEGIIAILEKMNKNMEEIGLKQFLPTKGERFDNARHEAIATMENGEPGTIYDIVQPGYELDGQIIRPAKVVVFK